MQQYSSGHSQAFELLYTRHRKGLFAFIRRQCNNHAVAEELAHDAWLAVVNRAGSDQQGEGSNTSIGVFKAWLYRTAHNRLVDHWRKHGRSAPAVFEEIRQHDAGCNPDNTGEGRVNEFGESINVISDSSTHGLELDALVKHLETLSSEQLMTLLLKVEGFSHREIAEITSAKQETVKSRLRYATQHLRVAMQVTVKI